MYGINDGCTIVTLYFSQVEIDALRKLSLRYGDNIDVLAKSIIREELIKFHLLDDGPDDEED